MQPKKRLYTVDQAIEALNKHFNVENVTLLRKTTVYRYLNLGEIKNYGPRHVSLIDLDELIGVVTQGKKPRRSHG